MAQPEEPATGTETGERFVSERRQRLRRFLRSDFVRSLPFWFVPFLIMGVAVYGGIVRNVLISLTDTQNFDRPDFSQLDFEMYSRALGDPAVITAGKNTFVLLIMFTTVSMVLGLYLAIMLDRGIRFGETVQTIYLLPMALSFVVTAQFWKWIYNFNNGLANDLMGLVGLGPFNYLGNPELVLGSVIFALIWQYSGYCMIVFLAGLRSIPDDQFEAAKMDGASIYKTYWRVILPQLKSASVSAAVVLMIFALKTFTFLYTMFGRYRPPQGSDILPTLMMRTAFKKLEWAYGAAIATIMLVMALSVIAPYLYYQYRQGAL